MVRKRDRQIREILENTQKALDKVDPGSLASDNRKANFEQAKAFLRQADDALKKEELTQARLLCRAGAEYRQATAVGPLGSLLGRYTPTK